MFTLMRSTDSIFLHCDNRCLGFGHKERFISFGLNVEVFILEPAMFYSC